MKISDDFRLSCRKMTYKQAEPPILAAMPTWAVLEYQALRGDTTACTDNISAGILKTLGEFLKNRTNFYLST